MGYLCVYAGNHTPGPEGNPGGPSPPSPVGGRTIPMNPSSLRLFGFGALLAAACVTRAAAGVFSDNIEMLVVAEHGVSTGAAAAPAPFVAFDGGYIEAGDSVAGDTPPAPDTVTRSLLDALAARGFQLTGNSPAIVITTHWGVLRTDHREIRIPYALKPNLTARIELVGTTRMADEVENHLLLNRRGSGLNDSASAPRLLVGAEETVLESARQPRYFVIVSAYDYKAMLGNQARLLWRTKMSARDVSGAMDSVIPTLIAGGARFFGQDLDQVQDLELSPSSPVQPAGAALGEIRAAQQSSGINSAFIQGLLRAEREKYSGVGGDGAST